jgi:RNA polymerase sigma-70 factor (ECF subfamily)
MAEESALNTNTVLTDNRSLEALREQMLKFAALQLGDDHLAEDAVQEALIGALKNANSFSGKAALKTWVFAILKNKIADVLRQRQRLVNASSLLGDEEEDEDFAMLFDNRGHWRPDERPHDWGDPEASFSQQQFWRIFEACLEGLPPKQARVFMMREFVGLESEEICAAVEISMSNLFVILHRARLRLEKCLEHKWFLKETPPC